MSALIGQKQPLIAPINPWKIKFYVIKVTDRTFYRLTNVVNISRCWETIRKTLSQHPTWIISALEW